MRSHKGREETAFQLATAMQHGAAQLDERRRAFGLLSPELDRLLQDVEADALRQSQRFAQDWWETCTSSSCVGSYLPDSPWVSPSPGFVTVDNRASPGQSSRRPRWPRLRSGVRDGKSVVSFPKRLRQWRTWRQTHDRRGIVRRSAVRLVALVLVAGTVHVIDSRGAAGGPVTVQAPSISTSTPELTGPGGRLQWWTVR